MAGRSQRKYRSVQRQLQLRDGHGCYYCSATGPPNKRMRTGDNDFIVITLFNVDHVLPRAQGGCNHLDNKVWSCVFCNREKADEIPSLYRWRPRVEAMRHINLCIIIASRRYELGLPVLTYPVD